MVYGTLAIKPVIMDYDNRGNLIQVTQIKKGIAAFTYDNLNHISRYTYGEKILSATSVNSDNINWTTAQDQLFNYNSKNNVYYLTDEQSTPIKLTNYKGKVVAKYSYDEYGKPSPNTSSFKSKDVLRGIIIDVQSLNRYCYCCANPIAYIDPSGYYTTEEGNTAHRALQIFFMAYYLLHSDQGTPYIEFHVGGVLGNISNTGRADMILDKGFGVQVYEIKPDSYANPNLEYNEKGKEQLSKYFNAIVKSRAVIRGGDFTKIANLLVLPYPGQPDRFIKYYTYPEDPGMIYYYIFKTPTKKRQDQEDTANATSPVTVKEYEPLIVPTPVPPFEQHFSSEEPLCGKIFDELVEFAFTCGLGYYILKYFPELKSYAPGLEWSGFAY